MTDVRINWRDEEVNEEIADIVFKNIAKHLPPQPAPKLEPVILESMEIEWMEEWPATRNIKALADKLNAFITNHK